MRLQVLADDQVERFAGIVALAAAAERQVPAYERDVAQWSGRPWASGDGVAVSDMTEPGGHRVPRHPGGGACDL